MVRAEEDDGTLFIRKAECQDFGHELADLTRGEVDDGGDEAAFKGLRGVMVGELGAGALMAEGGAKIDQELDGGFAGFWKRRGGKDAADADVDGGELVVADGRLDRGCRIGDEVHGPGFSAAGVRRQPPCEGGGCVYGDEHAPFVLWRTV